MREYIASHLQSGRFSYLYMIFYLMKTTRQRATNNIQIHSNWYIDHKRTFTKLHRKASSKFHKFITAFLYLEVWRKALNIPRQVPYAISSSQTHHLAKEFDPLYSRPSPTSPSGSTLPSPNALVTSTLYSGGSHVQPAGVSLQTSSSCTCTSFRTLAPFSFSSFTIALLS